MLNVPIENIISLPYQDCLWRIDGERVDTDENECRNRINLITVTDSDNNTVGIKHVDYNFALNENITDMLIESMLKPWSWKPRKPLKVYLSFDCDGLSDFLDNIGVYFLGKTNPKSRIGFKSCSICKKRGECALFELCEECGSVWFCSHICRNTSLNPNTSHDVMCPIFKELSIHTDILNSFHFDFINITCGNDFNDDSLVSFLTLNSVCKTHLWLWSPNLNKNCAVKSTSECACVQRLKSYMFDQSLRNRPVNDCSMKNWNDLYDYLGLSSSSIDCGLLSFSASIYYILSFLLPQNEDLFMLVNLQAQLTIHLLGVERETNLIESFLLLADLLPQWSIKIVMIGPNMKKKLLGRTFIHKNNTIEFCKGLYHDLNLEIPDLVIGLNAGLGAYNSWCQTLSKLRHNSIESYFTDYCGYSCQLSKQAIEINSDASISEPQINPFRSPLRIHCDNHDLPLYSNAFVYKLLYH